MDNNVIRVDIDNKEDIYNKFNNEQISEELGDYIYNCAKMFPMNKKMIIYINNSVIFSNEEKDQLVDAIREYYGLFVRKQMFYTKFNRLKRVVLFLIGILLIVLSDSFSHITEFLIPELFLIAGWVAIWEAVYSILFVDNKVKLEIKKARQLSNCEIKFKDYK